MIISIKLVLNWITLKMLGLIFKFLSWIKLSNARTSKNTYIYLRILLLLTLLIKYFLILFKTFERFHFSKGSKQSAIIDFIAAVTRSTFLQLFRSMKICTVTSLYIFLKFVLRLGKYIALRILRQIWLWSKCRLRSLSWWHNTSNVW